MDPNEQLRRLLKSRRGHASKVRHGDQSLSELAVRARRVTQERGAPVACDEERRQHQLRHETREATRVRMVEALRSSVTQLRPLLEARAAEDAREEARCSAGSIDAGELSRALDASRASRKYTTGLRQQLDQAESVLTSLNAPTNEEKLGESDNGGNFADAVSAVRVLRQELIRPPVSTSRGSNRREAARASRDGQASRLRMLRRRPPRLPVAGTDRIQAKPLGQERAKTVETVALTPAGGGGPEPKPGSELEPMQEPATEPEPMQERAGEHAAEPAAEPEPEPEPEPESKLKLEPETKPVRAQHQKRKQDKEQHGRDILAAAVTAVSEHLLAALAALEAEMVETATESGECWTDLTIQSLSCRLCEHCSKIRARGLETPGEMDYALLTLRQAATAELYDCENVHTAGGNRKIDQQQYLGNADLSTTDGRHSCAGLCAVLSAAASLAASHFRPETTEPNGASLALKQLNDLQVALLGFVPAEQAPWMLDATSKGWLIHLYSLAADPPALLETVLVTRSRAFLQSVGVLAPYASLALNGQLKPVDAQHDSGQCLQLRAFFRKSNGHDGNDLEEGEGRGPLLEYFELIGAHLTEADISSNGDDLGTGLGDGCPTRVPTLSMLGYHQGSEALWFAECDTTAQKLQQRQLEGQQSNGDEIQNDLVEPLQPDEPEEHNQPDRQRESRRETTQDMDQGRSDSTSVSSAAELTERWCAAGILLGTALTSRCSDALSLGLNSILLRVLLLPRYDPMSCCTEMSWLPSKPSSLLQQLCHGSATDAIALLQSYDPSIAAMARLVLSDDGQGFSDDEFAAMLELENLQDAPPRISREQYVLRMLQAVVLEPVQMQLDALRAGWSSAIPQRWLTKLAVTPAELGILFGGRPDNLVNGTDDTPQSFSWRISFRVVEDPELLDGNELLRCAFWCAMEDGLSATEKRLVLAFITGVKRPPAARSGELLRIEMPFLFFSDAEKKAAWGTLPQAHTCSNTLELPNYYEAWQWRRHYEALQLREGSHNKAGMPSSEVGNANSAHEDTETTQKPTVEELAGIIRERLLTAACGSQGYALDEV